MLPGACIKYVFYLESSAATYDAENITLRDILPEGLVFQSAWLDPASDMMGNLTTPAQGTFCDGSPTTCTVQLSNGVLQANGQGWIHIHALVK